MEMGRIWISAEISILLNLFWSLVFYVKKRYNTQIRAAMFRGQNIKVTFRLSMVRSFSACNNYIVWASDYQLIVEYATCW